MNSVRQFKSFISEGICLFGRSGNVADQEPLCLSNALPGIHALMVKYLWEYSAVPSESYNQVCPSSRFCREVPLSVGFCVLPEISNTTLTSGGGPE
jgi:hypothetical protein